MRRRRIPSYLSPFPPKVFSLSRVALRTGRVVRSCIIGHNHAYLLINSSGVGERSRTAWASRPSDSPGSRLWEARSSSRSASPCSRSRGQSFRVPVILGDRNLVGLTTLEIFGFAVDPVENKLIPKTGVLYPAA